MKVQFPNTPLSLFYLDHVGADIIIFVESLSLLLIEGPGVFEKLFLKQLGVEVGDRPLWVLVGLYLVILCLTYPQ